MEAVFEGRGYLEWRFRGLGGDEEGWWKLCVNSCGVLLTRS